MLNSTLSQLFVIIVIALIVIRPKDLPNIALKLGQWLKAWNKLTTRTKLAFEQQIRLAELQDNIVRANQAASESLDDKTGNPHAQPARNTES